MFFSKNSPYACQRTREQTQANLGADATESGSRDERVWVQMRPRLPPDSLTGIGSRRIDLKALEADCNAERMASALESRALKIQRKSSLAVAPSQRKFALRGHNHLLRRQHCSSLCSQSEGHEHVTNRTNALEHDFVGFPVRAWPPQYSPPHFASKVSYSAAPQTFAECSRGASCCSAAPPYYLAQNRAEIFLDFEHPIYQAVNAIANSPQKARSLSWNYDILSTRGRRSRCSRPRVTLLAAEGNATRGRE